MNLVATRASSASRVPSANSFYTISQRRVNTQLALWRHHLPLVKPYYAVKCNPEPQLMSWLAHGGAGFDCASVREVKAVKQVAYQAPIVFANPCKRKDEVTMSAALGVRTTVIDSYEEIDKLCDVGWDGASLIRIRVEDSGSMMPFSAKFGLDAGAVGSLAKYAAQKGQPINGISFHVGSGCRDPQQYAAAAVQAVKAAADVAAAGHTPTIIDIGGGFMTDGFHEAAAIIRKSQAAFPQLQFIAEPGRFFATTCQDLFVRVIGKKPGATAGWRYTLDESLYGQFSCIPFDHARPRWIRVRGPGEPRRRTSPAVLYGRTCDSVDFIAAAEAEELEEGDWLWFPHMGAYTTVTSTEFNGFPKPPTLVLKGCGPQLPDPEDFPTDEWPAQLKYVSAVQVPS